MEINQEVLAQEGRLKRYQDRIKQYKQNGTFPKNKKQIPHQRGVECKTAYQQAGDEETQQF